MLQVERKVNDMGTIRTAIGWKWDNSYTRLPETLYRMQLPAPVSHPQLALVNNALAEQLGLSIEELEVEGAEILSGNKIAAGSEPLAQAYAGQQFGHFTMLGDGRAILLGEHIDPSGQRVDIQLKGSGRTPYSRGGDGRAALGPMLREYIISEGMHGLGIPTSRSLAVVTTGEYIVRETVLPGAVLTRVAASHLRVGTFQYAAARGNVDALRALADYALQRHGPDVDPRDPGRFLQLLRAVVARQARLVAQWQLVGFIHRVMNTDNTTISGETIDYGPCAFMDVYDPATVFSSIDHHGRYAYQNQPLIGRWNLARFAETLLPLLASDEARAIEMAQEAIDDFSAIYQRAWLRGMRKKLGLTTAEPDDEALIEELLRLMHAHRADFTNTFRALTLERPEETGLHGVAPFEQWWARWRA